MRRFRRWMGVAAAGLLLTGGLAASARRPAQKEAFIMRLSSPAFLDGQPIPRKYTCEGADVSPPLTWSVPPAGTRGLALISDDPDAPAGTWVHWVIYDLPGVSKGVPEGIPSSATLGDGARQGKNSWGNTGYGGPSPPPGAPHRYFFRLYALRTPLNAPAGLEAKEVEALARPKSIELAEFMGTYGRT